MRTHEELFADPEGAALLRTVLETPEDDAPRMVIADWLDEHEEAAWAEVIRTQIRLAKSPSWFDPAFQGSAHARGQLRLTEVRVTQIVNSNKHRWAPWDQRQVDFSFCEVEFRRGFVSEIRCPALDFAWLWPHIFSMHPIIQVRLADLRLAGENGNGGLIWDHSDLDWPRRSLRKNL